MGGSSGSTTTLSRSNSMSELESESNGSGEDAETHESAHDQMRNILEDALESGVLEKAVMESHDEKALLDHPEVTSGNEVFNFAPSERLADQPGTSKSLNDF